jgi:hypothetical protein
MGRLSHYLATGPAFYQAVEKVFLWFDKPCEATVRARFPKARSDKSMHRILRKIAHGQAEWLGTIPQCPLMYSLHYYFIL